MSLTKAGQLRSIRQPTSAFADLVTGRYQSRFGFDNNLPPGEKNGVSLSETFGAKRLQELGYKTALIGKWHQGYPDQFHPNKRGFDWFYGCLQGSRSYFPIELPSAHRLVANVSRGKRCQVPFWRFRQASWGGLGGEWLIPTRNA